MDDRDLETELAVPKEPASLRCALLTSLCCAMGNTSHQGYHWLRSFNVCNRWYYTQDIRNVLQLGPGLLFLAKLPF